MQYSGNFSQHLHRGLLAAIVHVSAVRESSLAALAIEFDAACQLIKKEIAKSPGTLRSVFANGLPLPLFKLIAQQHATGDSLRDLRCRDLIAAIDRQDRAQYQQLVIAAAEAAIDAPIETDPYRRRRRAEWESFALGEIRGVFKRWP